MQFYVGLHQPFDAQHFDRSFISVNRLKYRRSNFAVKDWIMDSGAFSTLSIYGTYPFHPDEYVEHIDRWRRVGTMRAAVSQDYMCEPHIIKGTGLSLDLHQQLTISRYDSILAAVTKGIYILPVLQGYAIQDYLTHLALYGSRLKRGAWVGVGSICKRNSTPIAVYRILHAIKCKRPDLRLHGFGLKITALHSSCRDLLHSADSMAWSFRARKQGRDPNDWREAHRFVQEIER